MTGSDVDTLTSHYAIPEVFHFLWDGAAPARAAVRALLARSEETFAMRGYGLWVLEDPAQPAAGVVGSVGLLDVDGHPGRVELVYSLDPRYWGRGHATEAAADVLAEGFDRSGLGEILAGTDAPNVASQRVLARLGMRSIGLLAVGADPVPLPYWSVDRQALRAAIGR